MVSVDPFPLSSSCFFTSLFLLMRFLFFVRSQHYCRHLSVEFFFGDSIGFHDNIANIDASTISIDRLRNVNPSKTIFGRLGVTFEKGNLCSVFSRVLKQHYPLFANKARLMPRCVIDLSTVSFDDCFRVSNLTR